LYYLFLTTRSNLPLTTSTKKTETKNVTINLFK
jgi:hypothetical protein